MELAGQGPTSAHALPWISVSPGSPYFITEHGDPWTPIGQNDGLDWPDLAGLFRRRDMASVEEYLRFLADSGVTVLRLMLEYCHHEHRYFEKPAGEMRPNMVRLWDDLVVLCERFGLRLLLTPFDTFWMWIRWKRHPYNAANGGPCADRSVFLCDPATRASVQRRLAFATERWGASGVIFAWDLWNEVHTSYANKSVESVYEFITSIGSYLREVEMRIHGRAHPQTVSVFLPLAQQKPDLGKVIYSHPALDFASTHFYEEGTIDDPKDTVQPAISTGRLVRDALGNIPDARPFFDSEHGPIHTYKDHHRTLPEAFDDEYFRHMQWAHFASGGAGGAMRWPNRKPHRLTAGMRQAQKTLSHFLPLVNWTSFNRANWNEELQPSDRRFAAFGCGDDRQAIAWLLRRDTLKTDGMVDRTAARQPVELRLPWAGGECQVTAWDTVRGEQSPARVSIRDGSLYVIVPPVSTDVALVCLRG